MLINKEVHNIILPLLMILTPQFPSSKRSPWYWHPIEQFASTSIQSIKIHCQKHAFTNYRALYFTWGLFNRINIQKETL